MYFVHPQIKLNIKNFKPVFSCLFKKPNYKNIKEELSFYFPNKNFIFTDLGRTAMQIIIEKLNLKNSQMIVSAYTCDIFFEIFKKYNIQPIFLDIDLKTFNIKIEEIIKKITPKTKSILVCHTYGFPVDMKKIIFLAKRYNLKIIEDCAHSFGTKYKGKYLGNFGHASLFSLYKIFPSFRGGMLVCPKNWKIDLQKTSFNFRDLISFLNCFPVFAFLFKSFGSSVSGEIIAKKMLKKEKSAKLSEINRVSLNLFEYFLKKYNNKIEKRIELALFFQKELEKLGFKTQYPQDNSFGYFSALIPENLAQKRDKLVKELRKYKIFCTRIWHNPIILNPKVQREYNLNLVEFPNTIKIAKTIINFPLQNYFKRKDIKKIIDNLKYTLSKI